VSNVSFKMYLRSLFKIGSYFREKESLPNFEKRFAYVLFFLSKVKDNITHISYCDVLRLIFLFNAIILNIYT
jgi:hypothetical protein